MNADEVFLIPCPHCGATQEELDKNKGKGIYAYHNTPSSDQQTWLHVACLECGSGSPSVEVWNNRRHTNLPFKPTQSFTDKAPSTEGLYFMKCDENKQQSELVQVYWFRHEGKKELVCDCDVGNRFKVNTIHSGLTNITWSKVNATELKKDMEGHQCGSCKRRWPTMMAAYECCCEGE